MKVEFDFRLGSEEQTVGRSTVVEGANLVAFLDMLAFINRDLACGHLGHPNRHDAHQPDARIVGFDENERSRRHSRDVALRVIRTGRVVSVYQRLGVVASWNHVSLHDRSGHWAVPAVIAPGAQESLVDRAAYELLDERVMGHHMLK